MPTAAEQPPLTATQRALVEDHLRLVDEVIRALRIPSNFTDDARQDGALGLMAAATRYDPTRGVPFSCYARTKIKSAIRDAIRRRTHGRARLTITSYDNPTRQHPAGWVDTLTDPDGRDPADAAAAATDAGRTIQLLDRADHDVVAGLAAGRTLAQVGADLGLTESRVCQRRNRLRDLAGAAA